MKKHLIIIGLVIIVLGSFGGAVFAQSEPPTRLFIISPAPGEVIQGKEVKVTVRLPAGVTLDEYHVHLWLDALASHENELSAVLEEIPEHTYTSVFSGLHTIYAEAYRNDHVELDQRMFTKVEFETADEQLKPATDPDSPPAVGDGSSIARGSGNTLFALAFIAAVIGLLWYLFGRQKKHD